MTDEAASRLDSSVFGRSIDSSMPFELRSVSGLWLLGLLAPLIVLYVLKIRRQPLRVSSTWLWVSAQRDLLAKSPFRRLILQLPLILQILALMLLALALARPATRGATIGGDHVAIVVDTSASMTTKNSAGVTRIAEAREAARRVLRSLAPGADALIVEAGREPRLASPVDRDIRRLEAALERVQAHDVEGSLSRALAVASDHLRQLPAAASSLRRIVVVTDGMLADRDALLSAAMPVDVIRVGTPADNAAIVRVDVRSGTDPSTKRDQVQAFALVANFGSAARDLFVTLRQKNVFQPLASRRVHVAPGERAPVVLTFEPAPGDAGSGLVIEISPGDAMAVDDRAYGRVPAGRKLPVVMAPATGNAWVKRALLADPHVELMGAPVATLMSAAVPDDALVVVDEACPEALPGSDFLILNPPPGRCKTATVGTPVERASITSWIESDARMRFLTLDGIEILSARRIETDGPAEALVRARDATLISDISLPGRTGTLVAFDVKDSNWPLKASFVLFVRNMVELARTHRAHGITSAAHTGEPFRVRVPAEVNEVTVESPDAKPSTLPARSGSAVVPDAMRAGFYHVSWQGIRAGSVLLAANLASVAESDLAPRELSAGKQSVHTTSAADVADAFTDWTWLLALLGLCLIAFDVWWLTRRVRPKTRLEPTRPRLPERPVLGSTT